MKELSTFRATIVDECLHILLETFHGFFHFRIEALRTHKSVNKIVERLENFFVFREYSIPLSVKAFVFGLF